jgi:hypothetical protein
MWLFSLSVVAGRSCGGSGRLVAYIVYLYKKGLLVRPKKKDGKRSKKKTYPTPEARDVTCQCLEPVSSMSSSSSSSLLARPARVLVHDPVLVFGGGCSCGDGGPLVVA